LGHRSKILLKKDLGKYMKDQNFSKTMTKILANERPIFWQMKDQFFGK